MSKNGSNTLENIFLKGYRPFLWLIIICLLFYLRTVFFKFTDFDEVPLITNSFQFNKDLRNLPKAFTTDVFRNPNGEIVYYRPMLTVSLMLDAQIGGVNPRIYHLTNLILHILSVLLIFIFLQKLKIARTVAMILSMVFAIHPILSQAVAWVPGRNDSLLALFCIAGFIFFIDYINTRKIRYLFIHFIFFFLALLTKETGLIMPVLLISYLWVARQKIFSKANLTVHLAWVMLLLAWFLLRSNALNSATMLPSWTISFDNIYDVLISTMIYFGKILLPINLTVVPMVKDTQLWPGIVSLALLVLLLGFSFITCNRMTLFGIGFFLLFLMPTLLRPIKEEVLYIYEHRAYLPFVGVLILFSQANLGKIKKVSWFFKPLLMFIFLFFAIKNLSHTSVFRNKNTFWISAVNNSPHNSLAYIGLGANYAEEGDVDKAFYLYNKAIELNPHAAVALGNIGYIYMMKGNYLAAEKSLLKGLAESPKEVLNYQNIGELYYRWGKYDKVESYMVQALKINPNLNQTRRFLYGFYQETNQLEKAKKLMEDEVQLK